MAGRRLAGIHAALAIERDAFWQRAFDGAAHDPVLDAAEVDPRLVLNVSDIDRVVGRDQQPAGPAKLGPLLEVLAVLVEDLDALVPTIGDEHTAAAVERHGVRHVELAGPHAFFAPRLDELPLFRKL